MSTVDDVHHKALRQFVWTPDKISFGKGEYWKSLIKDYDAGKVMRGDCDDFALTCADALLAAGTPKHDLRLCICETETDEIHCVLVVGGKHLVDNRQRQVVDWRSVHYKWLYGMDYHEPGKWFSLT